jgi:TonB family protein
MAQQLRDITLRVPDRSEGGPGATGARIEPGERRDASGTTGGRVDPAERPDATRVRPTIKVRHWAVAAAVLLHIVAIVLCLLDWNGIFARAFAPQPVAIPVALIIETPPEPPPPPPRPPPPPPPPPPIPTPDPPPQPVTPRMSGADEKTASVADKPEPAPPTPKQEVEAQKPKRPSTGPSSEKEPPAPTADAKAIGRQAAIAPPARTEAPKGDIFHSIRLPSQPGGREQRDQAGDAYLNQLRDLVERNRVYPPASAFPGGGERVAVYSILVDPAGNLTALTLLQSSGSLLLDEAAGRMLRASAPFPPLPSSYPQMRTLITVEIPMFPNRG